MSALITPPASYTIGVSSMIRSGTKSSPNKKFLAAILMAIDEINNKNDGILDDLLPATTFKFYFREDINDFTYGTLNAYFNMIYAPTTIAAVGPLATPSGQGALPVYAASKVPVIGFQDRSPYFSDSLYYPNYLRTVPGFYLDGQATATLIAQYFQWDKVSVFYTNTQAGRTSTQVFRYYAEKYNVKVFSYHNVDSSRNNLITSINDAKSFGSRIFVLFTEVDIAFDLIEKGNEMKLFSSETQIIGGELLSNERSWNSLNTTSLQLNKLLKGFISVKYNKEIPSSNLKEAFISRWLARPNTNGSNTVPPVCNTRKDSFNSGYIHQFSVPGGRGSPIPGSPQPTGTCSGVDFSSYKSHPNLEHELDDVMYAYDSVLAVAYGLHHLIYDQNILPTPSNLNQLLLKNFSFTGLTGEVSFMTIMGDESFDIGGRVTNIRYDIVNYIPIENADTVDRNITFQSIIQWHSENGFTNCLTESSLSYIDPSIDSICQDFQYASTDNTVPADSPSPNEKGTPPWINEALRSISLIGLILTFLVITIIFSFRHRRLVKMSQPIISNIKKLGIMLGFIRVLLYTMETKAQICYGRLWLEHIAFQLIFSSIFFRSWRVYLVTCAMKRVKVTDSQCIFLIFLSILITIAILIAVTASGVTLNQVVIVDDQFNYNFQKTCQYNNQSVLLLMYIYDLLILVLSLIICWLIRKVNSTISNTSALVEGLLLTSLAIVGLSLLVGLGNLTPSSEQFVIGLVIALILLRLLWLFESKMIYNLFTGYELDRSLILRKSEKNILQLFGFNQLSHKIFAADDYEPSGQSGCSGTIGSPTTISNFNNSKSSAQQSKILKKYSKLKLNELIANLNLIKEDIELKQIELSSLENLIFLASQDDNSTNNNNSSGGPQNNKSSSHRNHSNHSESGNNDDIEDPDILKCNIPLSPSEKNDALSTELSTNQMNQNISTLLSSNDKFV